MKNKYQVISYWDDQWQFVTFSSEEKAIEYAKELIQHYTQESGEFDDWHECVESIQVVKILHTPKVVKTIKREDFDDIDSDDWSEKAQQYFYYDEYIQYGLVRVGGDE